MTRVDESIAVVGSSSAAVIERIEIAVRGLPGCSLARPAADVVQIAVAVRKLLGTRTHACTITLATDHRGLTVSLHGEVDASRLDALRAAILGRSVESLSEPASGSFSPPPTVSPPPIVQAPAPQIAPMPVSTGVVPPAPWSAQPVPPVHAAPAAREVQLPIPAWSPSNLPPPTAPGIDEDDGRTIMRPRSNALSPASDGLPVPLASTTVVISLSDGRRVQVTDRALIGRDPTARASDGAAILVAVADEAVSKTHVALGRRGDEVWIEDRSSTNGTMLVDAKGRPVMVPAGQRTVLSLPATIIVGDTEIRIQTA